MISYSSLLFSLAALAAIGWLGWISVQSYLQGARLCALPRSGGAVIEGETLAARGKVKVLVPLAVPGAFPCLWYRERVQEARSWLWRNRWDSDCWRTVSDYVRMATFAVVVDGEEIEVDALPTEVQCTQTTVDREDRGLLASLLGELGSRRRCEWLPVREEITVIGRLER